MSDALYNGTYEQMFTPETSQQQVYTEAIEPIVDEVVGGQSCCIFAYGQVSQLRELKCDSDSDGNSNMGVIKILLTCGSHEQYVTFDSYEIREIVR